MESGSGESHVKSKGKKTGKNGAPRAKASSWPAALSEFLIDWYIEKKLSMPPKSSFKQLHHTACTTAINARYGTTYTVAQVYRHWRRHRDTWGLVAKYLNESGSGWDENTKTLTLSKSTLDSLSANDRGILSKPIQFFDKLKELFSGSTADGSFMQDPSTAAESDNDDDDQMDMMNDMSTYDDTDDVPQWEDSDKLPSDSDECHDVAALRETTSQVSSSSIGAMKPNKKIFKRSGKSKTLPAATKSERANKSRASSSLDDNDTDLVLTNTLVGINKTLEKPVQVAPPPDLNKPLWDMLKNIQLLPDDRMAVGMYLCKPEFQVHRSFLISMGEEYLSRWVYKFLSGHDPTGNQ